MFKKVIFTVIGLYLLATLQPAPAASAENCDMSILTPIVEPGQPVQINIAGAFGGSLIENRTFNVFSVLTGKWVDVGSFIGEFGGDITLLNDNDGNPLFAEGQNTIIFRRAGLLGSQTDLCSGSVSITTEPIEQGNSVCQSCGQGIVCKTGLVCVDSNTTGEICLPGASLQQGTLGSGCVDDSQCSLAGNFECSSNMTVANFCNAPTTTAPGQCVEREIPDPIFTCNNRGGQCSDKSNTSCTDNVRRAVCGGCWISPTDPAGGNFDDGTIGSCVITSDTSCGLYEANCCWDEENKPYCTEGVITPEDPISEGWCVCKGGDVGLGNPCTSDSQCKSDVCLSSGVCGIANDTCQYFGEGAPSEEFCESLGGVSCLQAATGPTLARGYCCPTIDQCISVGGTPGTNFDAYCGAKDGLKTAIGCIPFTSVSRLVAFFITWGIGLVGGFGILLIIYAGIQIISSGGDPTKLQTGKELLTSALTGIAMLIFSIFILRLIGVNVLGLF